MQLDDGVLLLFGKVTALYVRTEIVDPSQSAALAASQEPCTQKKHKRILKLKPCRMYTHTHKDHLLFH